MDKHNINIRQLMVDGLENSRCVVVFITSKYRDKVNGTSVTDNCKVFNSYCLIIIIM